MMARIEMKIHKRTERAILVSDTGKDSDAIWLPLSLVEVTPVCDGIAEIDMPEWLASREGLI